MTPIRINERRLLTRKAAGGTATAYCATRPPNAAANARNHEKLTGSHLDAHPTAVSFLNRQGRWHRGAAERRSERLGWQRLRERCAGSRRPEVRHHRTDGLLADRDRARKGFLQKVRH